MERPRDFKTKMSFWEMSFLFILFLYGIIMEPKTEKLYEVYCRLCNRQTIQFYNGLQKDEFDRPAFYWFTCKTCEGSFSVPLDGLEMVVEKND